MIRRPVARPGLVRPGTGLRLLLAGTLIALAAALSGGCSGGGKQTVVVLGPWTGNEAAAFTRTLDLLDNGTPYTYSYQGTSSLRETLVAQLEAGAPPDVAILNSQGELLEYAREGALTPLSNGLASKAYPPWAPELVVNGSRHSYWVPLKVDIKSLVWTRTSQPVRPHSWCLGMSAQATTGWPGTDWIEDILLHRSGPDAYEKWATGALPWTSPEVRDAWSTWASLMAGQNTRNALDIPYTGRGGKGLLNSGTCTEEHAGTFIRYLYGPDVTFEPSAGTIPGLGAHKDAYEVSADMAAVFRDSPAAMKLLSRLAGPEGRRIWMAQAEQQLKPHFPSAADPQPTDPLGRKAATLLTGGTSEAPTHELCFDASDTMPPTLRDAFQHAVLKFLSTPDSATRDKLLTQLEEERRRLPGTDLLPGVCGSPAP
ncbi:extracellular solute-binding protein [Streptomyces sp. NBC_00859]|uniref:extracellular solute-binding protein n=1 Tax=Streptomyces sp. NBC_00859 TaxID=2903682 RepID=UPI0038701C28|nr:ABC transporter substrate-binding protein [Streptomyces sp. NBC_00859]